MRVTPVARIRPSDSQRLVRAWEVLEATGRSLADWQGADTPRVADGPRFLTLVLMPERAPLYAACDGRSAGTSISIGLPMASSADQPKRVCADEFHSVMRPTSSIRITARCATWTIGRGRLPRQALQGRSKIDCNSVSIWLAA